MVNISAQYLTKTFLFITTVLLLTACKNKKANEQSIKETAAATTQQIKPAAKIHTDTLQFIYFEGNFDYWSCIFLNSSKDTITLVTDSMITNDFKNRLFEVKWFTDTLYQAGDNDSKFAANRMSHFKPIKGKFFVAPLTEQQILQDIRNIPEVQSGADQVNIAESTELSLETWRKQNQQ
jgi:PBP1b-binding outer membrane lipoprotein LpoB